MYIILLLISTLTFSQKNENEIGKSEAFRKLMNLHKIASQEKHNIDYYSIQIYSGNYNEADSLYKLSNDFFISDSVFFFYETPNYKIQVGKFWNKLKAQKKLKEIQKKFKSAFVLKPKGI
tara:strand:+ start:2267 stop:2626 length:360 start_codon:yes stop_codon:yes gene_type:complete